ncbi:unnamed protein product [Strongylus vulgaris]|uniref:Uncharacterized protein n=1 Tax=Strongylus vulgaris TaxID=40348 RepID=A0A3P7KXZ6_STRVU|nr:unnamed protein product [Strongylus vulgaris]
MAKSPDPVLPFFCLDFRINSGMRTVSDRLVGSYPPHDFFVATPSSRRKTSAMKKSPNGTNYVEIDHILITEGGAY